MQCYAEIRLLLLQSSSRLNWLVFLYGFLQQATSTDQRCSCMLVCRVPCCNIQPCRGRRCRVPGTTTFRRCKRSSAAEVAAQNDVDSSSNGSLNRLVDVMLDEETAYDTATADEEYYYTYEEDDVEDPVHMTAV